MTVRTDADEAGAHMNLVLPRGAVTGSLDAYPVQVTVARHARELCSCLLPDGATDLKLAGTLEVSFGIRADGQVHALEVTQDTLDHPDVAPCVARTVQRMRFPEPAGPEGVQVRYPILVQ